MKTILVTGGAGFIGSNLVEKLLDDGYHVIAVDNFDDYYDSTIKHKNISETLKRPNYIFINSDVCDNKYLQKVLPSNISAIIHLAAKAGVRSSIMNPSGYEGKNTQALEKTLELAEKLNISQFIFASSSSIYGNCKSVPFTENIIDLSPLNPYANSKLLSEQIGKVFSEKYNINFISLRLFSVYGPRLRPDLVMNKIADNILLNKPIKIFGNGSASRDYTYIDDIASGIINSLNYKGDKFDIINLGCGKPISLLEIISVFENLTGEKVKMEFSNFIEGESDITWADNSKAKQLLNFKPKIDINEGIGFFLKWYCKHHNI
jgi:UDP-glucuronate 4-epimerase